MGAQSVTGRGVGSAENSAKGVRERNFVGVEKLIGPRVVEAGKLVLTGGAVGGVVTFRTPLPCVTPISAGAAVPTPENDYVIMWRDETTPANNDVCTCVTANSDATGDVTVAAGLKTCLKQFTIALATADDTIGWVVMKVGD